MERDRKGVIGKKKSGLKSYLAGFLEKAGSSGRDRDCFFFGIVDATL